MIVVVRTSVPLWHGHFFENRQMTNLSSSESTGATRKSDIVFKLKEFSFHADAIYYADHVSRRKWLEIAKVTRSRYDSFYGVYWKPGGPF